MCLYGDGTKIDNNKREIAIILGKSLELANRSYWNNTLSPPNWQTGIVALVLLLVKLFCKMHFRGYFVAVKYN